MGAVKVTSDIKYIGVNDERIKLFEEQYPVKNGMSYNSYAIIDEKIAVMDTVDAGFTDEWLNNVKSVVGERKPDYLIVQHMEPDHSANIANFMAAYENAIVVSTDKAFAMMEQFFGDAYSERSIVVKEGDILALGKHKLKFIAAPMVHWPEVIVTYDDYDKVLFSADGFGTFGALTNEKQDEIKAGWAYEARRYYIGIVGKYGVQVQNLLKKVAGAELKIICPLHGPVLTDNLNYYLGLYNTWSTYDVEKDGIMIAYTSVYGNTKKAVEEIAKLLHEKGCPKVAIFDLARCDMSEAVANAFCYGKIILATTTYNSGIFPFMRDFVDHLVERNFQNRTVGIVENGSWAPMAAKVIKGKLADCKNITYTDTIVTIKSTLNKENEEQLEKMTTQICKDYLAMKDETANKNDMAALFKIGYGLYVITSNDGKKDNGLIVNTVSQVTNTPNRIAVTINKDNYSHDIINQTGIMNLNCLSTDAPFSLFANFGFQSGREANKFENNEGVMNFNFRKSDNGLAFLTHYINAFISLKVEKYIDFDTHGMFVCSITEARVISDTPTMTYDYYLENVKPKPETEKKKGFVCKVCGYIYEGDSLPEDFICPLCKHGASDFEVIN